MKIVYVTDVHGNMSVYNKLLKNIKRDDVSAIIIGGDISPGFDINEQRDFIRDFFIPLLEQIKLTGKPVFTMMGNDDYNINLPYLEKAEELGLVNIIHNNFVKFKDFYIVGYSFVNEGPHIIRDWVKKESDISKDLENIISPDPSKTIYVFHDAPKKTKLDIFWSGDHIGSEAIKEFIVREQPMLSLHGHVHESPDLSGDIKDNIGKTLSINPGNESIIILDLDTMNIEKV